MLYLLLVVIDSIYNIWYINYVCVSSTNTDLSSTMPRVKRKKVSKWLSEEALKIAKERKDMRSKGKYEEYRNLNAAFQKKARQDKDQSIRENADKLKS